MNKSFFYTLMGGLLLASFALTAADSSTDALARKTGGAPERLMEKQRQPKGATQQQPDAQETRLTRKVGGYKTRLLFQRRHARQA